MIVAAEAPQMSLTELDPNKPLYPWTRMPLIVDTIRWGPYYTPSRVPTTPGKYGYAPALAYHTCMPRPRSWSPYESLGYHDRFSSGLKGTSLHIKSAFSIPSPRLFFSRSQTSLLWKDSLDA